MANCTITRPGTALNGSVILPASKSISNRLLIIRSLCNTDIRINNLSTADDTLLLQELLGKIRAGQTQQPDQSHADETHRGFIPINCMNAGTVLRFLTAYLAATSGAWFLTGSDRMLKRPVGILVEALRKMGASIEYDGTPGYPPLRITGKPLKGGEVTVDASVSSQFVSALLLIAPTLPEGLTIRLIGKQVSFPYVEMTLVVMEDFGATVERMDECVIVRPGHYRPLLSAAKPYTVEADWSSAAFWYEAVAIASACSPPGSVPTIRLPGLVKHSLQGDAVLAELFRPLGVETHYEADGILLTRHEAQGIRHEAQGMRNDAEGTDGSPKSLKNPPLPSSFFPRPSSHVPRPTSLDLSAFPDLAPALIVTYAVLGIPARFTGLHHLAIKESNRLAALIKELKRLGVSIRHPAPVSRDLRFASTSGIIESVESPAVVAMKTDASPVVIETCGDHRIAMAFAPVALLTGTIGIEDPSVVSKSYPGFWEELRRVGFGVG